MYALSKHQNNLLFNLVTPRLVASFSVPNFTCKFFLFIILPVLFLSLHSFIHQTIFCAKHRRLLPLNRAEEHFNSNQLPLTEYESLDLKEALSLQPAFDEWHNRPML